MEHYWLLGLFVQLFFLNSNNKKVKQSYKTPMEVQGGEEV
jgi:hypothetical protein